jgi:exonuclease VII small subunit
MAEQKNLTESLSELETIVTWFEGQEEVDVEEGLTKVKAAATLIKDSKARLAEIENEFRAIEKEINDGEDVAVDDTESVKLSPAQNDDRPIDLNEIPF